MKKNTPKKWDSKQTFQYDPRKHMILKIDHELGGSKWIETRYYVFKRVLGFLWWRRCADRNGYKVRANAESALREMVKEKE